VSERDARVAALPASLLAKLVAAKLGVGNDPDADFLLCKICGGVVQERTWAHDKCYSAYRETFAWGPPQPRFALTREEQALLGV
jgi:hypothetical protein